MATSQLTKLLGPRTTKSPSPSTSTQILSLIREARLPRPGIVLELGETALSRLSENTREYWDIVAQICASAADLGEYEIMESILKRIMDRFPNSARSFVLLGRCREARGQYKAAMDTYIDVIKVQPMSPAVYKRQVAVLKSEMKTAEAVAMLNYYLDFYCEDSDAWAELCALCLSLGRLSHALFAASELVVHDPANHAFQTLAADVYMTIGGVENVIKGREHYASSLMSRKHGNLRALYGLWLACSILHDNALLPDQAQVQRNDKLLNVAQTGIRAIYEKLRKDSGSKTVGASALAAINLDVVTGKKRVSKSPS